MGQVVWVKFTSILTNFEWYFIIGFQGNALLCKAFGAKKKKG